MNKELEAKIEEEIDVMQQDSIIQQYDHLDGIKRGYKAGTKSKAFINWLVPYVVELARKGCFDMDKCEMEWLNTCFEITEQIKKELSSE